MSGLILLFSLLLCAAAGFWLVRFAVRKASPRWKTPVMVGLTLFLLTAPFVDEVIGKYQFEALCKANGIESADVSKARGKRVKILFNYDNERPVTWKILPITETPVSIEAEISGEVLFEYKNFHSRGGWLMRYTPFSMGSSSPMLFVGNGCDILLKDRIFLDNEITQTN